MGGYIRLRDYRARFELGGKELIKSVGIDLAGNGEHKVRCLDEQGQLSDGFSFDSTPGGLAKFEERVFKDGSNPVIVFEPTGLAWLIVAVYIRGQHPGCRLVRTQGRNVVALRKYLHRSSKSDKLDALTLAKMPFVDQERLNDIYLHPAKLNAILRLARQRQRLEAEIAGRKKRILSIINGYIPGIRQTFSNIWSPQGREFLRTQLNPLAVARSGENALDRFLTRARFRGKEDAEESHTVYLTCKMAATIYEKSRSTGAIDNDFFAALQDEIARELRLMEAEESESEAIAQRLQELYKEMHPSNNLRTIPGVGEQTAPIFLAVVGDPARFPSQSAFANYNGVVPDSRQSANTEAKGLRMTKAGPAIMKLALYQSSQIGRRFDPQLAWVYYHEIMNNGKNHKQAMGAVMSHIGARILAVLRENKPYELRDLQGKPITWENARRLILANYQVPEEVKQERRRCKSDGLPAKVRNRRREMKARRAYEAAITPQPVVA
jgi:transposase